MSGVRQISAVRPCLSCPRVLVRRRRQRERRRDGVAKAKNQVAVRAADAELRRAPDGVRQLLRMEPVGVEKGGGLDLLNEGEVKDAELAATPENAGELARLADFPPLLQERRRLLEQCVERIVSTPSASAALMNPNPSAATAAASAAARVRMPFGSIRAARAEKSSWDLR